MASGVLGADEAREKDRWSENRKVYTRRKRKPNAINTATATAEGAAIATTTANRNDKDASQTNVAAQENNATATTDEYSEDACQAKESAQENNGTVTNIADGGDTVAPAPDSHSSPRKDADANLQPHQQGSPSPEAICDDSANLNWQEKDLLNGNGLVPSRPIVTQIGDKISIHLSSATPKQEARNLKRKLLSNLDQLRNLAKKLDTKESQLYNGVSTNSGDAGTHDVITGVVGPSLFQYSTSGLIPTGLNDSRLFQQFSVSVMDISRHGGVNEILEKEKRTPKANQFYQSSEFICGKDKLHPAESNKRTKSSGRKKQSGGYGGSEFGKRMFKNCSTLLQQLMKHKFGWVFNTPVDVKGLCLHDYYDVIKHPMDLGTVKNRLSKNWYKSPLEFAEDVRLTFNNAMTYNPEGQDVHVMALELSNLFKQKWSEIGAEYNRKLRYEGLYDMGLPTPASRLAALPFYWSLPPATPAPRQVYSEVKHLDQSELVAVPADQRPNLAHSASFGRAAALKKPKAKDPNKRNMTFEEKQKLSSNLQGLPPEKLDSIVQIIKKRNSSLCQQDEEIEVDIDSVDAETLWELDRFVINYKKTLSKHKRKAELALQRAQAQQAIQANNPDPLRPKVPNETDPGGNANVSTPNHDGKQTDNASYSSSSSSSSSDSGSSSSDSDSDSSSSDSG